MKCETVMSYYFTVLNKTTYNMTCLTCNMTPEQKSAVGTLLEPHLPPNSQFVHFGLKAQVKIVALFLQWNFPIFVIIQFIQMKAVNTIQSKGIQLFKLHLDIWSICKWWPINDLNMQGYLYWYYALLKFTHKGRVDTQKMLLQKQGMLSWVLLWPQQA